MLKIFIKKIPNSFRLRRIFVEDDFLHTAVDSFNPTNVIREILLAQLYKTGTQSPNISVEFIMDSLRKAAKSKQWTTLIDMLGILKIWGSKITNPDLLMDVLDNGNVETLRKILKIGIYPKKMLESIRTDFVNSSKKLEYNDKIKIIEKCVRGKNLRGIAKVLKIKD
jgi:hypothetical protein